MAKPKLKQVKTKKPSSKYSKLLVVAGKELETKKKALIQAERALAKSKQKHEELISEVARLDMVERSLKAIVEGTEPPTNVKYVYNYPQWVWYQPQQFYVPSPYTQPGYWQNGQWTAQPSITTCQNADMTSGGLVLNTITSNLTMPTTTTASSFTTASLPSITTSGALLDANAWTKAGYDSGGLVVDLTTHADSDDAPLVEEADAAQA
jgi:hypothetical protein